MKIKHWLLMKFHKLMTNITWKYTDRWEYHKKRFKYYNNNFAKLHYGKKFSRIKG